MSTLQVSALPLLLLLTRPLWLLQVASAVSVQTMSMSGYAAMAFLLALGSDTYAAGLGQCQTALVAQETVPRHTAAPGWKSCLRVVSVRRRFSMATCERTMPIPAFGVS